MNEWFANPLFWIAFLSLQSVVAAVIVVFGRMWPKISTGLTMAGGLGGIAALLLLSHLTTIEDIVLVDKDSYIYEKLSLHILLLEVLLVTAGLTLAILSFLGYKSIVEIATRRAVEVAVEKAGQEATEYLKRVKLESSDKELRSTDLKIQPNSPEEEV